MQAECAPGRDEFAPYPAAHGSGAPSRALVKGVLCGGLWLARRWSSGREAPTDGPSSSDSAHAYFMCTNAAFEPAQQAEEEEAESKAAPCDKLGDARRSLDGTPPGWSIPAGSFDGGAPSSDVGASDERVAASGSGGPLEVVDGSCALTVRRWVTDALGRPATLVLLVAAFIFVAAAFAALLPLLSLPAPPGEFAAALARPVLAVWPDQPGAVDDILRRANNSPAAFTAWTTASPLRRFNGERVSVLIVGSTGTAADFPVRSPR